MTTNLALTLTLLITAERQQLHLHEADHKFEYDIHNVIDATLTGWSDERKADLYARIVESVDATTKLADMEKAIARCIERNTREFPHG